jgi:hypothetical protein
LGRFEAIERRGCQFVAEVANWRKKGYACGRGSGLASTSEAATVLSHVAQASRTYSLCSTILSGWSDWQAGQRVNAKVGLGMGRVYRVTRLTVAHGDQFAQYP